MHSIREQHVYKPDQLERTAVTYAIYCWRIISHPIGTSAMCSSEPSARDLAIACEIPLDLPASLPDMMALIHAS